MNIDGEGVSTERSISRTAGVIERMRSIELQGILSHGMRPKKMIRTHKSLIRPLNEHVLALVWLGPARKTAINKVDQAFLGILLRRKKVSVEKLRTLRALFWLDETER